MAYTVTTEFATVAATLANLSVGSSTVPSVGTVAFAVVNAAMTSQLTTTGALEQDALEAGVDLIDRLEDEIAQRCGATTPLDQALALIGRRHRADSR